MTSNVAAVLTLWAAITGAGGIAGVALNELIPRGWAVWKTLVVYYAITAVAAGVAVLCIELASSL